ncbi:MAG TPA: hypothetical protein VEM59_05250 [Acidimicrobiia bacterium]|nr:hypothetical protein [Acidimicrobiia bacterium]
MLLGGDDAVEQPGEERRPEQREAGRHQHDGGQGTGVLRSVGDCVDEDIDNCAGAEHNHCSPGDETEPAPEHSKRARENGTHPDCWLLVGPRLRHRRSVPITTSAGST